MMSRIKRLWRGEVDLARTFWVFGFAVSVLCKGISVLLVGLSEGSAAFAIALLVFALMTIAYQVYISVAIWRSANLYQGYAGWAFLAKAVVVLGALQVVASLFGVG